MSIVQDIVRQMRLRQQGNAIREFAKKKEISSARAFADIARALEQAIETGKLDKEELLQLFHRGSTFGHKRMMLLRNAPSDVPALGELKNDKVNLLPVTGRFARRPVGGKKMPGFYEGKRQIGDVEVHTFVTTRNVNFTEEVELDVLTDAGRKMYEGSQIIARTGEAIRCFDHVVKVEDRWFLLIDEPPTVDRDECRADIELYTRALEREAEGRPYVDLWPVVKAIYEDGQEGAINFVRFESNEQAQATGEYGRLSEKDYRQQKYHAAGAKEGQVSVFAIGVRWKKPDVDNPYVALLGKRMMLRRQEINGEMYPPLYRADFLLPTTERAFHFVVKRILKRLS